MGYIIYRSKIYDNNSIKIRKKIRGLPLQVSYVKCKVLKHYFKVHYEKLKMYIPRQRQKYKINK